MKTGNCCGSWNCGFHLGKTRDGPGTVEGDHTDPCTVDGDAGERARSLLEYRHLCNQKAADLVVDVDDKTVSRIVVENHRIHCGLLRKKERERIVKLLVLNGPNLNFSGNPGKRNLRQSGLCVSGRTSAEEGRGGKAMNWRCSRVIMKAG